METVEPSGPSARKATIEDLPALHALWQRAGLPWNELERFVNEFQVVPGEEGLLVGAIGLQLDGAEGLLHSEAIFPGVDADEIRAALWRRAQIVARNQGAIRLWTLEDAPFWTGVFVRADKAAIEGLRASFRDPEASWSVHQLVDPARAQKLVDEQVAVWEASRQADSENLLDTIQRVRTAAFAIAGVLIAGMIFMIVYLGLRRPDVFRKILGH
ncbi:MAG: hypothetical protein DVB31_16170 [Verrucomicrobia bacterium]|nr:MAG: hypothetical protein DVB31_16170 [Verrucomicrobiota bacterium]